MIGGGGDHGRIGAGPDPILDARLPFLVAAILFVFVVFGVRFFQLQILQGEELRGIAEGNAVRLVRLEAPRGEILDREGRVIATTRPAFGVSVIPSDLRRPELTYAALGLLLDGQPESLRERVGTPRGRMRFQPVTLEGDLSFDQLARVESHLYALPGVLTDVSPRRDYVGGDLAAHLIGTIGEIRRDQLESDEYEGYRQGEVIGQTGIEQVLERSLRGQAGGRNVVVNVAGRVVQVLDEIPPVSGGTVTLTIDLDLQRAAEEAFLPEAVGEPAKMGAAVALDVRSGEVLALVSKPAFDPNDFAGGVNSAVWKQLTGDEWRPLQNRAISGQYPPGSTYKPIVAAAALAEKVTNPQERVFCPGHFTFGNRTYRCWKKEGHGSVDLHDAIKKSCDVYFYTMGLRLGVDRLAEYARAFGLGRLTGIPLPQEKPGLIPTSAWKQKRFHEKWMAGETVSIAIGQGYDLTTPLQLAVAYASLANGGRVVQPHLVLSRRDASGEVVPEPFAPPHAEIDLPESALHPVLDGLAAVVEEPGGTGGRSRVPGVRVGGKTGTAQAVGLKHTEDMKEHEIPIRYRDHAWFVAFAPVEAPEIAVAVLNEHGGHGGSAAAPIAQKILQKYFEKQGRVPPQQVAVVPPTAPVQPVAGGAGSGVSGTHPPASPVNGTHPPGSPVNGTRPPAAPDAAPPSEPEVEDAAD